MTEMEILGYLITFLETFQFCCVTIYGLRREDMTLKELIGYAGLSVILDILLFYGRQRELSVYLVLLIRTFILAFCVSLGSHTSFRKTLLVFGSFHVLEELICTWIVILLCIGCKSMEISFISRLAMGISRFVLCIAVLKLQTWQRKYEAEVNWRLVLLLLLIGCAAMFYFQSVLSGRIDTMTVRSSLWASVVFPGIFCMIYLLCNDIKNKEQILKLRIDMAEQQYEELAIEYEKNRILYHDMNHHNLVMWKLAEKGEYERLHEYLEKLRPEEKTEHRQWTQNPIIDMILEYKTLAMEKKQITYRVDSDIVGEISISDKELCSLFANLLDNAIEACEKLEQEERKVHIQIRKHNAMFMLVVENSCEKYALAKSGIFRTGKPDKAFHGYGLHSIRQTVRNQGGQFEYGQHENNFYVKILIALVI